MDTQNNTYYHLIPQMGAFIDNIFEYNYNLLSSRFREADEDSSNRIIRLMEAKPNAKQDHNRMIDIEYTKDEAGDQNVDVSSQVFSDKSTVGIQLPALQLPETSS